MRLSRFVPAVLLAIAAAGLAPSGASEPRDYGYLFLQGKLTLRHDGRPEAGATLRLTAGDEIHSAVTDDRGFFSFEKLPRGAYDLELTTRDGEVIRRMRRVDTAELAFTLAALDVGLNRRGSARKQAALSVGVEGERTQVTVPDVQTRWNRLRGQSLIFVAIALVLAL